MTQHQRELDAQHGSRMRRLERLLEEVDATADGAWREKTREIVQAVLEFHGAALNRVMEHLDAAGAAGDEIVETLADDDLVSSLLVLHGLHPHDFAARVAAALDGVRPYLASHGGNVELLACTPEGAVRLRLEGSCHGCPSSRVTLQQTIEEALYAAAPDIT